ncbi:MAG TPA: methanol--corrinoid methyltransferase [Firmicutes bacterium]|nr:methanol--corrinoid methyltransferase [Bacillota bacterium]
MHRYDTLAISSPDDLLYGRAPRPLKVKEGLVIGGGTVYPEVNFTLPPMNISAEVMPAIYRQYEEMIEGICKRAVELELPGLVVEFELLPPMTMEPQWGAGITEVLRRTLDKYAAEAGLKSALRVTPNDIREHERPPLLRTGYLWEKMVESFRLNAAAGADLMAIESTGGKELHDDAIIMADLPLALFALGVLGCRDMDFLWDNIVQTCQGTTCHPAGDSACGFGNSAMVLAEKGYIPKVWSALIRVMTVPRSLVAHEKGAVGPGKDCAYENPYLKAITGLPMSGEGSEAACAHLSPVGNIARAAADLWSNESVQNVRLLGGMAPVVSLEQLAYATRLLNTAAAHGPAGARQLRNWYVESDANRDPQAYILRPDVVIAIAKQIVAAPTPYLRTRTAALATLAALRSAVAEGELALPERELTYLDLLSSQADSLPEDEADLIGMVSGSFDREKIRLDQYELDI